jgi:hypothetical protein
MSDMTATGDQLISYAHLVAKYKKMAKEIMNLA